MIFLTSDLHLAHDKPFIYANRGFDEIEKHDIFLVNMINKTVCTDDSLWILGDVCMGNLSKCSDETYLSPEKAKYIENLLSHIDCKDVHIIRGNHESDNKVKLYKSLGFLVHGTSELIVHKKHPYLLSHYPTLTANGCLKGELWREVINLHGHIHTKEKFLNFNNQIIPLCYNVCVDANELKPVNIEEIRERVREEYDRNITV